MYDNVLYPTDGSDGAEAALETVRDLARTYDATVHVLYAAKQPEIHGLSGDVPMTGGGGMSGNPEGAATGMRGDRTEDDVLRSKTETEGQKLVELVATRLDDVETRTAVEWGEPYEVILEYADEHDVDIVVMGTHGRTGIDRYLIGSVAERVIRKSDEPVLTVRANESE
ncbi:MAG: universal stress protein [Natronomonas sp.]